MLVRLSDRLLRGWRPSSAQVRLLALLSVLANSGIVLTGGAVRLTGSGLGCPTVPRCTDASYFPTGELGVHGLIEFSNRMLTFVLTAVVLSLVVACARLRPRRGDLLRLTWLGLAGIPAQAVLGAVTVRTGLNPWTVGAHFLVSMGLIAVAVVLHRRTGEGDAPAALTVPAGLRTASQALLGLVAAVLVMGTVVTGSGPHSGDADTGRTGFDLEVVSQVHADLVFLLVGSTVGLLLAFRATGSTAAARAAGLLLAVELSQGVVGFVQYWTDLPVLLVALHLLGACLTLALATRVVVSTRERGAPAVVPGQASAPLRAPRPARAA